MSIRSAFALLFDVGSEAEAEPSGGRREEAGPREAEYEATQGHLYGQAEAIRVLYQTSPRKQRPPKPPRGRRARGLWIARYLDSLSASLPEPVATKA